MDARTPQVYASTPRVYVHLRCTYTSRVCEPQAFGHEATIPVLYGRASRVTDVTRQTYTKPWFQPSRHAKSLGLFVSSELPDVRAGGPPRIQKRKKRKQVPRLSLLSEGKKTLLCPVLLFLCLRHDRGRGNTPQAVERGHDCFETTFLSVEEEK